MPLKDLSTADRPREKLAKLGATYLTTSELLAILLNTSGVSDRSVLDLARDLLGPEGSLRTLAAQPLTALTRHKGIGPAKAVTIKAAFELAHRYEEEQHPLPDLLRTPAEIAEHFFSRFRDATDEVFHLLSFNARQKLLDVHPLARGSLMSVETHPRDIFARAFEKHAASIILLHNHPSGCPTPSGQDETITAHVKAAGDLLGIPLLDHIIIGDESYFSFHEAELL